MPQSEQRSTYLCVRSPQDLFFCFEGFAFALAGQCEGRAELVGHFAGGNKPSNILEKCGHENREFYCPEEAYPAGEVHAATRSDKRVRGLYWGAGRPMGLRTVKWTGREDLTLLTISITVLF